MHGTIKIEIGGKHSLVRAFSTLTDDLPRGAGAELEAVANMLMAEEAADAAIAVLIGERLERLRAFVDASAAALIGGSAPPRRQEEAQTASTARTIEDTDRWAVAPPTGNHAQRGRSGGGRPPAPPYTPTPPPGPGEPYPRPVLAATDAQIKAIFAIGHGVGLTDHEIEAAATDRFGALPSALNRRHASELIDHLKSAGTAKGRS